MLILKRWCKSDEMGVFGTIYHDGEPVCVTVEQPWRNNLPFHSCVPAGQYQLVPFNGSKYKDTFALYAPELDVHITKQTTGRYACVIHSANMAEQLQGCIAPGRQLSAMQGKDGALNWAITSSRDASKELLSIIRQNTIKELNIEWELP